PAAFVERLRIDEACHRLSIRDNSVDDIAVSVGFKSVATFRRAFQRRLGINPNDYRRRVAPDGESVRRLPHNRQKVQSFSRAA
ncbi:MAG TPA: helix-turn-helix domain-containing protein, partial [Pyrinomonadaceae bacterium]